MGEETNIRLTTTSFQASVKSNMVSPQPRLLQTEQPQFPQLLLIRFVLQTLYQPCCPSLDMLQHLNALLAVRGPCLSALIHLNSAFPESHPILAHWKRTFAFYPSVLYPGYLMQIF